MNDKPLNREQIFESLVDITDPSERARMLDEYCGADAELRGEVKDLLERDAKLGSFLDLPQRETEEVGAKSSTKFSNAIELGSTIDRYVVLEAIGEGGMGSVWLAEQQKPVRRRVAIKIIKKGVGSREIVARFEAERQALALMNHPNIARILDAGTTEDGQPFFAMELVQGLPLTTYCDKHRLGINERLKLFTDVCSGVQHAHQKGIIHRDLKPSNILVAQIDGKPVPKVIDFGLAKALESTQRLTDQSLFTGMGQILGTLKYMSPEQATLDMVDIDTRTDIYSMGVILYEMLTGSTPLDDDTVRNQALTKVLELIREKEPIRPSRRLRDSGSDISTITEKRRTDSSSLNQILEGDLDWVIGKSLEKDRARRYASVSGLVADIQRFLQSEPVTARPPSVNYRIRKFYKKNRGPVLAATAVLITLLAGILGTSLGLHAAINARDAEKKRADSERVAKENAQQATKEATDANALAQTRLMQVEKSNEDLYSIFEDLDIRLVRNGTEPLEAILAERLVEVSRRLTAETVGDEKVLAKLQNGLGRALVSLGFPDDAIPILEDALSVRTDNPSIGIGELLESTSNLSAAYNTDGQWEKALDLDKANLTRSCAEFGPDSDETYGAVANLAHTYLNKGDFESTIKLMEPAYNSLLAKNGPEDELTVRCGHYLATSLFEKGELNSAHRILKAIAPHAEMVFGASNPDTITVKQNLAATYQRMGQVHRALPLMEELLEDRRSRLGRDHPDTLQSMVNVAGALGEVGKFDESVKLMEQALPLYRKRLGADHPDALRTANFLVIAYKDTRRIEEAVTLIQETLDASESSIPEGHPLKLALKSNLAMCHWLTGEFDLAIEQYENLLRIMEARLTRDHPDTLMIIANLGVNHQNAGRPHKAIPFLEEVNSASIKHPGLRSFRPFLLSCYLETNDLEQARDLAEELVDEARTSTSPGSRQLSGTLLSIGKVFLEHRRFKDAEPLLRECVEILKETRPDHWITYATQTLFGEALAGMQLFARAEKQLLDGFEGLVTRRTAIPPHAPPEVQLPATYKRIIELYESWHIADPEMEFDKRASEWQQKLKEHISDTSK